MTISLDLPPATIEKLEAQAKAAGTDVESVVREAIAAKLLRGGRTFREILKPIRDEVEQNGMSLEEVDSLIESAIKGSRAGTSDSVKP